MTTFFVPGSRSPAAAAPAAVQGPTPKTGTACDESDDPGEEAAAWTRRLAAGEQAALTAIYRREAAGVYRYVLALAGNPAWAADSTHDAFAELARRPLGFDARRGTLGAYLAGIARHALAARRRECRLEDPLGDDAEAPADQAAALAVVESPEAVLVRRQDSSSLWAALRALPVPFREAIVLVDLQERSYVEAAQIAGVELNTLRSRLHRARARLAVLLGSVAGGKA